MEDLSPWERELMIKNVSKDTFTNVSPLWDWKGRNFISGTQLMAQCLRAASQTLSTPEKFLVHELHTNFIRAGSHKESVQYQVVRLSDGKEFSTRMVRAEQNNKLLLICSMSFKAAGGKSGSKIMRHSERWKTSPNRPPENGRDDVADIRPKQGGNIEGYVLPNVYLASNSVTTAAAEQYATTSGLPPSRGSRVSPSWMRIRGPVSAPTDDRIVHLMGMLYVSDVFVLDAGPRLCNIDLGFARIPDAHLKPDFNVMLTLNSSIHIHERHGWRCDNWFYVENECAVAAEDGRFLISSNIFTRNGKLLASTRQEGYSIFNRSLDKVKASI